MVSPSLPTSRSGKPSPLTSSRSNAVVLFSSSEMLPAGTKSKPEPVTPLLRNSLFGVPALPTTRSTLPSPSTSASAMAAVGSGEPRLKVSSTSTLVPLIARVKVPSSSTPGMLTSTVPLRRPASPPGSLTGSDAFSGRMMKAPSPSVRETNSVVPSPRPRPTSLAAKRTTGPAAVVICSKAKLPSRRWPNKRITTSSPSTRRNGPAGTFKVIVWSPRTNSSANGPAVVLMARPNSPSKSNWLASSPGILMPTSPERLPAMPSGVSRKKPSPSASVTTSSVPALMPSDT